MHDIVNDLAPTVTRDQRNEMYAVHAELCALHSRIHQVIEDVHNRGLSGGAVLDAQIALGNAIYVLSAAISEVDLVGK